MALKSGGPSSSFRELSGDVGGRRELEERSFYRRAWRGLEGIELRQGRGSRWPEGWI